MVKIESHDKRLRLRTEEKKLGVKILMHTLYYNAFVYCTMTAI